MRKKIQQTWQHIPVAAATRVYTLLKGITGPLCIFSISINAFTLRIIFRTSLMIAFPIFNSLKSIKQEYSEEPQLSI